MRDVPASWLEKVWRRTSLVQRLTCVALVPTAISAILLVTLLTRHQMDSLRDMGRSTADAIAQQAASISGEALRDGETGSLSIVALLLRAIRAEHEHRLVAIRECDTVHPRPDMPETP